MRSGRELCGLSPGTWDLGPGTWDPAVGGDGAPTLMSAESSPGSPARARSPVDGDAPETPQVQKDIEIALCNSIDFDKKCPSPILSKAGLGLLVCIPHPPLGDLPTTPLEETILGLKVEVDRLVEELAMVRSRAELFASAHVATVTAHGEERAGLFAQVMQKPQLLGVSTRDLKALSIELDACKLTCTALRGAACVPLLHGFRKCICVCASHIYLYYRVKKFMSI